jgi:hypothetical protein
LAVSVKIAARFGRQAVELRADVVGDHASHKRFSGNSKFKGKG